MYELSVKWIAFQYAWAEQRLTGIRSNGLSENHACEWKRRLTILLNFLTHLLRVTVNNVYQYYSPYF